MTQSRTPYILLGFTLLFALIALSFSAFHGQASMWVEAPQVAFILCLWLSGTIYLGHSFYELNSIQKGTQFLNIPASGLEKWLSKFFLAFIVFPIIITVAYAVLYYLFSLISPALFGLRFKPLLLDATPMKTTYFLFYAVAPLAFVSSLLWKKYGLLKTVLCAVALLFIIALSASTFDVYMPNTTVFEVAFPFDTSRLSPQMKRLNRFFWAFLVYIPGSLTLVASYFLMKEYEL